MYRSLLIAAGAACLAGCGGTGQPFMTNDRLDKGLVIVLPGIHGRLWLSEDIMDGLNKGGIDQGIEIYDWTYHGHWLPFYNLGAVERNHQVAKDIAAHIHDYQQAHPGRPVTLVGYSGGGPLAVWVAESMPKEPGCPAARLDGVILLSTPLVPTYDLSAALDASRKGIVSFHSARDMVYLGMGTLIFGTMDLHHVVSAGNVGFSPPDSPGDRPAYQRLFQVEYSDRMANYGYMGTHLSIGAPSFIAAYIAPLVRAAAWDSALVGQLPDVKTPAPPTSHPGAVTRVN